MDIHNHSVYVPMVHVTGLRELCVAHRNVVCTGESFRPGYGGALGLSARLWAPTRWHHREKTE